MLIAHLIGGVVLLASFLLRMPQASSTLSLLLTAFKSVAPVSFLEQIEDVFSSPAFIDSSSFYSDVISTSPAVTDLVIYYPPSQLSNLGSATSLNVLAEVAVQEVGQKKCSPSSNWDEEKPVSAPTAYFSLFLLLASPCAVLTLYLTYTSFSLPNLDLGFGTSILTDQNEITPAALLATNATSFVIVWPTGSWFNLQDYLSVVFDEVPQTQLSLSIPSSSDVTVTIIDEDGDELEEDPDKTITPEDFYRDDDTLSICVSPMFPPLSPIFSDCPSLTSGYSSSDESILSPTADHTFSFNGPSPPRIEFDYDDPNDYMYPSYDPFEDQEFDYGTYEDVDEALAIIGRRSQRKRYMVGLFPGVNESFLQRDVIPHDHFIQTKHKCLDRPGLDPSDVRCCPHWYRCEKSDIADGDRESETARILILNLNYSIVLDETRGTVSKQVTVIYDSERLKPILRDLGATKMTIYCPADLQDYPYAVVDFPDIVQSRAAFQQLQGRCLGYSGRHLRIVYAPLYDYTFGGRHTVPEDTRDIMIMSLEPEKLRLARVPEQKPDESSSPASSPQKNKYSRMVVTKYGRRIQMPSNLC